MRFTKFTGLVVAALAPLLGAGPALAQGYARDWQITFQEPATPSAASIVQLANAVNIIIVAITIFVFLLLGWVMLRYNAKRNPVPSKTTHNTLIEVVWTVVPVIILVGIAIPSFKQLYFLDRIENADMTIKAIGHQWYWSYEYPDHGDLAFDAFIVPDDQIQAGQHRLLETDRRVVLPVDTNIRVLITASDVLHAWAVPAFGVKMDAVPGRVNETWFRIEKPGVYYGQCSELCGVQHAYMPIAVEAVSKEEFEAWVQSTRAELQPQDGSTRDVAMRPAQQD